MKKVTYIKKNIKKYSSSKENHNRYIHTSEGYVRHTPPTSGTNYGAFDYVYNYTDHLGNVRLSYTLDPSDQVLKILEENHYYPFGMKHSYNTSKKDVRVDEAFLNPNLTPSENGNRRVEMVSNTGYQYKYNGKEYQDELGLAMYDYGARNYDPAIGRWMNIDPLAEKYRRWSPYNYVMNSPMRFVDPDGMRVANFWIPGMDKNGNLTLTAEKGDNSETLKNFFKDNEAAKKHVKETDLEKGEYKQGEKVTLKSNVFSKTIKAGAGNYDCKEFCMRTVIEGEPISDGKTDFPNLNDSEQMANWGERWANKKEINKSQLKPLESFFVWGSLDNHAAVYFGKDNSGNEYFVTKNGKATLS